LIFGKPNLTSVKLDRAPNDTSSYSFYSQMNLSLSGDPDPDSELELAEKSDSSFTISSSSSTTISAFAAMGFKVGLGGFHFVGR
jgi:hypothetical protein